MDLLIIKQVMVKRIIYREKMWNCINLNQNRRDQYQRKYSYNERGYNFIVKKKKVQRDILLKKWIFGKN